MYPGSVYNMMSVPPLPRCQHHQDYLSHYSRIRGYLNLPTCDGTDSGQRQALILFFPGPGKNSASNERDDNDDDHEGKILKNIIYLYIYNHGNVIAFEPEETRRSEKPGSRS